MSLVIITLRLQPIFPGTRELKRLEHNVVILLPGYV